MSTLSDLINQLDVDTDRDALAEEFEVSLATVARWASGVSMPAPAIAARVERWCIARLSDDTAPRLHIQRDLLTGAGDR